MSINPSLNYDAERNSTISVKYSDIPDYLRESAFYKSLSDEDPEDTIEIPAQCFHPETNIESDYDFYCHLRSFHFWGFETIPTHILDYCSRTEYDVWKDTAQYVLSKELFDYLAKVFRECDVRLSDLPPYLLHYWKKHHHAWHDEFAVFTTEAAADGALDLLGYLHLHQYQFNNGVCCFAAAGGHLECLQFLHESGCPWDADTCYYAALHKHFDCLRYAHEQGCPWTDNVTFYLCDNSSDLNIAWLQYVLERGCQIDKNACALVIDNDRFDCLLLLHEYNAPWSPDIMILSVFKNNIQYVQYLYDHGCPWDEEVVRVATTVPMLSFLFERNCPYGNDLLVCSAIWEESNNVTSRHRLACLQYLVEVQGLYMHEDGSLLNRILESADLDCVQYLIDQGCPFGTTEFSIISTDWYIYESIPCAEYISNSAYDTCLLSCLQYAVEHGWKYTHSIVQCVCYHSLPLCMEYLLDQPQIKFRIAREEIVTDDKPIVTYTPIFDN